MQDTTPNHPISTESSHSFISSLFQDGDNIEFRALREHRDQHKVHTLYRQAPIAADDDSLVEWLTAHNSPGWSLYIGPNPRRSGRGSGAAGASNDGDVILARSLFVDFDDADPKQAVRRIEAAGLPEPTLLISSGRATGTHAYWIFEQPVADLDLWRRLQTAMIRAVNSDKAIKNPSRIMRLPGSDNHKRGAPCRILKTSKVFTDWETLGIEPEAEFEAFATEYDPDRKPMIENLNNKTHAFLADAAPEGERNNRLVAAAFDYNANNFSIDQAIQELALDRSVQRDGLPEQEAIRTVRNAYRKKATPSFSRTVIEEYSATELVTVLNGDRGMPSADFKPGDISQTAAAKITTAPPEQESPRVPLERAEGERLRCCTRASMTLRGT